MDAALSVVIPDARSAIRNPDEKAAVVAGFRARGLTPTPRNDVGVV